MKVMIRLLALARWLMLSRQARELRRIVQELPISAQRAVGQLAMAEIQAAAREPQPHLYGSEVEDRYQPWGDATHQAFIKAQSKTPQVKLRGIALWIARNHPARVASLTLVASVAPELAESELTRALARGENLLIPLPGTSFAPGWRYAE